MARLNSNEDLFMALLLMVGPDPEPDSGKPSDVYREWRQQVHAAIAELTGGHPNVSIGDYNTWLQERRMAWAGGV